MVTITADGGHNLDKAGNGGSGRKPPTISAPGRPESPGPRAKRRKDGYSLFVWAMKFVLPALAGVMMLAVLIWPNLSVEEGAFRVGFLNNANLSNLENLTLVGARYMGTDKDNRPFKVTAEMANQVSPESDAVTLSVPAADVVLEDGKWLALTAKTGEFLQKSQKLNLQGQVSIFHDDGYSFHTESVSVDMKAGNAEGFQSVVGYGPLGTLRAEGFKVIDKGRRIVFTGVAKLVIRPDEKSGSNENLKRYFK